MSELQTLVTTTEVHTSLIRTLTRECEFQQKCIVELYTDINVLQKRVIRIIDNIYLCMRGFVAISIIVAFLAKFGVIA